ncbi:hypothetical protein Lesp02_32490 [Lentzea sp. NBRC 105346]|uniref:hypothetical protein n=1 Tax=Lentzea sp. NBRC 105346 TaxID=3032205 RepID=UPI0024A5733D|nr:hypothetical protein [Lentzea sp. NBRC 105346]GLZ31060.1 hypothetical protein Lesp02_32490 [Lentzea sp. NBRC 105346]
MAGAATGLECAAGIGLTAARLGKGELACAAAFHEVAAPRAQLAAAAVPEGVTGPATTLPAQLAAAGVELDYHPV